MADYTVSVDAGNGGTNAILVKGSGRPKRYYEPSVRAAATGDSLGLGSQFELEYDYVDWYGHRYVTGDDVLRVTRRNLERHVGSNRYGNEFHQFLVAVALAKLGVKKGTVDLTVFAPPGMYNDLKEGIQANFTRDGEVAIALKNDKKPRTWNYEQVTVWPEGIGAAACFVLDDNGDFIQSDILAGEVVVIDIGVFTLDALRFTNGNFNPEALEHATWENAGLNAHLREPVLRTLKSRSDEFANVTVDDIDQVMRAGLATGDYNLRVAGLEVDLQAAIDKHRERYAGWIANNVCDGMFDGFRGIKSVILVGGGASLVEEWLEKWYGDKLLDPKKHPTTKKVTPVDLNATGGLRLALMRQKQAVQS